MQIRRQAYLPSKKPPIRPTEGVPLCGSVVETEIARCVDLPRAFAFQRHSHRHGGLLLISTDPRECLVLLRYPTVATSKS